MSQFAYAVKQSIFLFRQIQKLYCENKPQKGIIWTDTGTISLTINAIFVKIVCPFVVRIKAV